MSRPIATTFFGMMLTLPLVAAQPPGGGPGGQPPGGGFGGGGRGGFGGPGGMMGQQNRKVVQDFDKNGDGWLNAEERKVAREIALKNSGGVDSAPAGGAGPREADSAAAG